MSAAMEAIAPPAPRTSQLVAIKTGPFRGFFSRGTKFEAPAGYLTGDSHDWDYRPRSSKWKRRAGSAIVGDTISAGHENLGLLAAKWSARPREVFELVSSSLADSQPTHAATYTSESGPWGQIYWRDTNGADTNEVLGGNYASDYPAGGLSTPNKLRMMPLWSENALVYSRAVDEKQRRLVACGSRNSAAFGTYRYWPNLQGTPIRWNVGFNDSTVSSNVQRVIRWGHIPPLWTPDLTLPAATTTGNESWLGSDRFAYSICYRFEDGSIGRPFIPRPITAVAKKSSNPDQNWCGWVDMLHATGTNAYQYVQWNHFPRPPDGAVSVIMCRTVKATQSTQPSLATLGVIDEQPVNISTYKDYGGGITPLLDPTNIRLSDHKFVRRARHVWSFYGHVAVSGKLKQNPAAIVIAPRNLGGTYYNNDDSVISAVVPWVAVREDQVAAGTRYSRVLCGVDANEPTGGVILGSGVTIGDVVDQINRSVNTDRAYTYDDWKSQPVPGVADQVATDNLQLTQVYANFSTVSGTPTITVQNGGDAAAGSLTNIKVGMKVEVIAGAFAAGTYIGSVGATTCGLVDSAGVTKNATGNNPAPGIAVRIGWDFGDNRPGEMRVNSSALPAVIDFTKTYLDTLPVGDRDIDFTSAEAGIIGKYCANLFYIKNRRSIPQRFGNSIGCGGEVAGGAVAFYTRGMARFQNTRGGNTNADDDWQLQPVFGSRGTISPCTVQGNGVVFHLTEYGIEAVDESRAIIISDALYDAGEKSGELAYEIAQCKAAAITDTDGAYFQMLLSGGVLYVSYRSSSGSSTKADRYLKYDFSPTLGAGGLDEVLRQDGSPYGWSCPHKIYGGPMGEVQRSDGTHLYMAVEGNQGSTGDGRIDEFETGTTDNSTAVTPLGYCSMLVDEDGREFALQELRIKYRKTGTGFRVGVSRDKNRTGGLADYYAAPTSGTDPFTVKRKPALSAIAANKEACEIWFDDDGTGDQAEVWIAGARGRMVESAAD